MNKTILMGRLTKNPEMKCLQDENSTAMARYTLAVDRRYRKDGKADEYSNAIVHAFQKFRAPFSGKIVHIFPEQSAVI